MKCSACAHENRGEAKFCEQCGAALANRCQSCNQELRPGAKFCDQCGTAVDASASGPTSVKPIDSTPKHIADAILRDRSKLEGERRTVTVLFADAVGHTTMSEQLGEEEMYGLMQGCFGRMQEAVHRYGGTVNQYTGDGILALFGAPIAHEDSARRAVAAALEMQCSLKEYADEVKKRHPIQCAYRVGLNTGPVVIGKISDDLDLEFAAVGDTVNLAARMEAIAESGAVYLTGNTHRAVRDYYECEDLGPQKVKGKSEPVTVYRALQEKAVQTRFDAAIQRGLTPYVGRDEEQKMLSGYLDTARSGKGQVVLVSGEAGMGKSRALIEFHGREVKEGVRWLQGQCISFGENIPYLPAIDLLKRAFDIQEGDTETEIIEKIESGTSQWDKSAQRTRPYIKYLLNVDPGDERVSEMDPLERRAGFFDAFRALVTQESKKDTLVIVIEDLHWVDEKSQELIDLMVDLVATTPVFLLLTSRPGYRPAFQDRSYFSRLTLAQLPNSESAALTEQALGAQNLPLQLQQLITKRTEGNPFYIEEVTRSLVESGALVRSSDAYELQRPVEDISVPDTIQEVILSRIDRLEPQAREAIQLASVIGREFTPRLLERISNLERSLEEALSELKALELIYETGYLPELSYMFKHALTHDVAYSTLLVERRRGLHQTVANAIESLFEDRVSEHYEALAHHYEESQTWDKALEYLDKAGDKAVAACANQQAIGFYRRALGACTELGAEARPKSMEIAEKLTWVYFTIADYDGALQSVLRILNIGLQLNDPIIEGQALSMKGLIETYQHDFDAGEASLTRAIELSNTNTELEFMGRVGIYALNKVINRHDNAESEFSRIQELSKKAQSPFGLSYWTFFSGLDQNWRGNFAEGARRCATWKELPDETPEVMILHVRWSEALSIAGMGNYTEALTLLHGIANDCERLGEIAVRARAANTIGWILGDLMDLSQSIEFSHRGVEIALEEGDEPEKISNARLNWSDALIAQGRFDEAETILKEIENVVRHPKPEDRWMLWRFSQHLYHSYGALELARGNPDKAISLADECLVLAEPSESRKYIVKARRLRGEALLASGDTSGAHQEIETALRIANEISNPPQHWKSLVAISETLRAQNERSTADDALRDARKVIAKVAQSLDANGIQSAFLASDEIRTIQSGPPTAK